MKKYFYLIFVLFLLPGCGKQEVKNYPNSNTDIIAFGDSLIYGYGAGRDETYPSYLSQMLGREVVNLGVSGDTSALGLARIKDIERYSPYMVLIEFSANDFFRKIPKDSTENNLKEIVRQVQDMGAIAVLVDTGGAYPMEPYTKIQKQIAKDYNTLFVPGIMDGIYNKKDLKSDQIHPNDKGYKIVAQRIKKIIEPYLN
ncbi:MAG: hypothetical protein II183_02210 [Elusimicrobiaceae bacterium]|nr:hypothetical protein [Elusimicrobiaceae bacterium]